MQNEIRTIVFTYVFQNTHIKLENKYISLILTVLRVLVNKILKTKTDISERFKGLYTDKNSQNSNEFNFKGFFFL